MNDLNHVKNHSPLVGSDITRVDKTNTTDDEQEVKTRESFLEKVIQSLSDISFSQDSLGNTYASYSEGEMISNTRIESRKFKSFLRKKIYTKFNKALPKKIMSDLIDSLAGVALTTGKSKEFFVRTYKSAPNEYFYDLAREDGTFIKINDQDWSIVKGGSNQFIRPSGMLEIPIPKKCLDLEVLKKYFCDGCEGNFLLIISYLIKSMIHDSGPFPILCFMGEQGTGKSWKSRAVKSLIDPSKPTLRSPPKGEEQFALYANSNWLLALDNLSTITNSMSDIYCRLSTGGGFATRKLYSNEEEFILEVIRPILINGINSVTTRGDFLERSLIIELNRISKRKPEKILNEEFNKDKPLILGTLFSIFSKVLSIKDDISLENPPRMADFATIGVAVERVLGFKEGVFLSSYENNMGSSMESSLEKDNVALALYQILRDNDNKFEGTVSELFEEFIYCVGGNLRYLPRTPGKLSEYLKRLAPLLKRQGIEITWGERQGGTGRRMIRITFNPRHSHE